jgi:hypothetical protein
MRFASCLILISILGCAPEWIGPPPDGPGGDHEGDLVQVVGYAFDSVTGVPAAGVRVDLDGKVVDTDVDGRFTATVYEGRVTVRVTSTAFEPALQTVTTPTALISLPLRRLAPAPFGCRLEGGTLRATIVDLQGRKSLERWNRSALTIHTPVGPRTIGAVAWGYEPPDDTYHWDIYITDAGPIVERVDWRLFDSDLNAYTGTCVPETGGGALDSIR